MGAAGRHRHTGGRRGGQQKALASEEGWLCEEGEREGWDMNGRGPWGQRGGIDTGGLGYEWKGAMGAAGRHRHTGWRA